MLAFLLVTLTGSAGKLMQPKSNLRQTWQIVWVSFVCVL